MTTPPGDSPPAGEYDLNRIKNIDPAQQQQLQTLLAIATVIDLANASAAAIETAFQEAGYPITRANASDWIAQARQLIEAETRQSVDVRAQQVDGAITPALEPTSEDEAMAEAEELSTPAVAEEWQTLASVRLEFQTLGEESAHRWRLINPASGATRVLTDQPQEPHLTWLQHLGHAFFHLHPNEVSGSIQTWLDRQIPLIKSPIKIEEIPTTQLDKLTVQVRQVMLLQPPETSMPIVAMEESTSFPGALQANQPFQVGVSFELLELKPWALPSGVTYSLECFAKTLTYPHRTIPLGKSQFRTLTSGQTQYKAEIAATPLPSGLYKLQVLIAFQGVDIPLDIHEISRLQVI